MNRLTRLSATAIFIVFPAMGMAMGCNYGEHKQQVQSCIAGTAWDEGTQSCKPVTSS